MNFEVGDVVGYLTVTSIEPFVCNCACGEVVSHYRPWNLRNGCKSCGCMHRGPRPNADWWVRAKIKPIKCLNPDDKHGLRRWVVACAGCGLQREASEWNCRKASYKPGRKGCFQCHLGRMKKDDPLGLGSSESGPHGQVGGTL
jgi:hypothetical protein